jgi:uncharacterized membrane protein
MNKQQYINELTSRLSVLSPDERSDILRDVEEHFREAGLAARSDESVVAQLGSPKVFADMMIAETKVNRIQTATTLSSKLKAIVGAAFAILVLTPFNLIFVLIPLILVTSFIVTGWPVIMLFILSLPIACIAAVVMMFTAGFNLYLSFAILFFVFGWCGLVIAMTVGFYYITLFYVKGVSALFKWNLQFIKRSMR